MVFVYRTGDNGEEKFNEITMANVQQESDRYYSTSTAAHTAVDFQHTVPVM